MAEVKVQVKVKVASAYQLLFRFDKGSVVTADELKAKSMRRVQTQFDVALEGSFLVSKSDFVLDADDNVLDFSEEGKELELRIDTVKSLVTRSKAVDFYETSEKWSERETQLRNDLAAAYRLFEIFGWSDSIYGHLTVRTEGNNFLINPFGLAYSEITPSSLVKVDEEGAILDAGSTSYGINPAGFVIHSAVHRARKDVNCVMHSHETSCVAVASHENGLLRISQTSQIVGPVSYHEYEGIAVNKAERARLVEDLGDTNKVLFLRNHGVLTCGSTIAEAFFLKFTLVQACKIQVAANWGSAIAFPPSETYERSIRTSREVTENEGFGEKEFSAWCRTYFGSRFGEN